MHALILICSTDAEFCLFLRYVLKIHGFKTDMAQSTSEAVQRVEMGDVSAVILDCQPYSTFASAICAQLKSHESMDNVPIFAFVTNESKQGYLELLKAGIDQTFVRPISPELFLPYMHSAVSSRKEQDDEKDDNIISFGQIKILEDEHRVQRDDGKDIHLSPIEYKLLREMSRLPGQVFSRDDLIRAAWPNNIFVELRTVDVHIGRLRRLLTRETGQNLIRTVRSEGYAMYSRA